MLQPLKHWRKVVLSSIDIKKWFLNLIRGINSDFIQLFYPMSLIRTCRKWKQVGIYAGKLILNSINNQLGPARRAKISKMFGYLFFSTLRPQPNISTLTTLVFLFLQKFKFALHLRYCCIIRTWSSDFNPSSYLRLWMVCVHERCTADTSLGEELIRFSSLGAGDFILRGLITF